MIFIMAVPKQRHTKSHRNKRRMHLFLGKKRFSNCPKCGKPVLPHMVCLNCGYYKGREVVDVLAQLEKKERKKREKEMKAKEKEEKKEGKPLTMEELSQK